MLQSASQKKCQSPFLRLFNQHKPYLTIKKTSIINDLNHQNNIDFISYLGVYFTTKKYN